jgi:hypothetical protein
VALSVHSFQVACTAWLKTALHSSRCHHLRGSLQRCAACAGPLHHPAPARRRRRRGTRPLDLLVDRSLQPGRVLSARGARRHVAPARNMGAPHNPHVTRVRCMRKAGGAARLVRGLVHVSETMRNPRSSAGAPTRPHARRPLGAEAGAAGAGGAGGRAAAQPAGCALALLDVLLNVWRTRQD